LDDLEVFRKMATNPKVIHVSTWEEFKKLAITLHPEFIAYTLQKAPLSRPPLGLRLVFATESAQYVFLDFAHDNAFRKTRLVVYFPEGGGDAYFKEEDLKNFIQTELGRKDISIISFEVLGY
jgi:hypothetical protein